MSAFTFYLGALPRHLGKTSVPLFISRRQLSKRKRLPEAAGPWALDSGGFTELSMHGRWTLSPRAYVDEVRRFAEGCGRLSWAAPQDWMREPQIRLKTGLSVREHQERTTANLLELRALAPELTFIPVLQGWTLGEYFDHVEMYQRRGVDLTAEPLVGVGSVCRRQAGPRTHFLLSYLAQQGLRLHAFGFSVAGLRDAHPHLASADSMAWSFAARRQQERMDECEHKAKDCRTCLRWALWWRGDLLDRLGASAHTIASTGARR